MPDSTRLQQAFAAIDRSNAEDPNRELCDGEPRPKELLYGQRMSACLAEFAPDSSDALQLAARSQHIQRWKIARQDYPQGRQGYLNWRRELGQFHARCTGVIMADLDYEPASIARVQDLLQKKRLKQDAETQTLEDVSCLVFLQHYLADFARKHSQAKLINIIQKTWGKMSAEGQAAALKLPLDDALLTLVQKALAG